MGKLLRRGFVPVMAVCCPVCHSVFEESMQLRYDPNVSSFNQLFGQSIKIETEPAHMFADEDCICGTDIISHVSIVAKCPVCQNVFTVKMDLEPTTAMLVFPPEEEEYEDEDADDILRSEVDDNAGREVRGESADGGTGAESS